MSSHVHTMVVNLPIKSVWMFIDSVDEWSRLIPGYIQHEILNEKESEWLFTSNFGIMKKKIHLKAIIKEWIDQKKIALDLIGISDPFSGTCNIETKKVSTYRTHISIKFEVQTEGPLVKILKPLLKTNKNNWADKFKGELENIIKKFETKTS